MRGETLIGLQFGRPNRKKWPSEQSFFQARSKYQESNTIFQPLRQSIADVLFPASPNPEAAAFRERYHLFTPNDIRIDIAARAFAGFTFTLETLQQTLGYKVEKTTEAAAKNKPNTIVPTFYEREGNKASLGFTRPLLYLDGQLITDSIPPNRKQDVTFEGIQIEFNLTYTFLESLAFVQQVEAAMKNYLDTNPQSAQFSDEQKKEIVRANLADHLAAPTTGMRLGAKFVTLEGMIDLTSAGTDVAAVEEIMHSMHMRQVASEPGGVERLINEIQREVNYEEDPLERSIKPWTLYFLHKYYPGHPTTHETEEHMKQQNLARRRKLRAQKNKQ